MSEHDVRKSRIASPEYRWYVAAQAASMIGTSMSNAAIYWLAIHAAHGNALVLSVLVAVQFLPILILSGRAGTALSRHRAANVLLITQSVQAAGALLIAIPLLADWVSIWQLCLVVCAIGTAQAFDVPGRQMFMLDLVGERDLRRGASLYSTVMGLSKILGPAIAGGIIAAIGEAPVFIINAGSFLFVIAVLLHLNRKLGGTSTRRGTSTAKPRRFRWLFDLPRSVQTAVAIAFLVGAFGYQFEVTNPLMATDIFHLTSVGFGLLGALLAAGGVAGNYYSSRRGDPSGHEFLVWAALFGVAEAAAAVMPYPWAYTGSMFAVGAFLGLFTSSALVFIQKQTPSTQRTHAVSAYNAAYIGFVPAGAFFVSGMASTAGIRWSILVPGLGILTLAPACAIWKLLPHLGRFRGVRTEQDSKIGADGAEWTG